MCHTVFFIRQEQQQQQQQKTFYRTLKKRTILEMVYQLN